MQAVIMAAGKGTRLRPLTNEKPKTLLEVKPGRTILDFILEALPKAVDEVILVVNYRREQIEQRYGNQAADRAVRYVFHEKLDGSAMAVRACQEILGDDFLALNGDDLYCQADLERLAAEQLAVLAAEKEGQPSAVVKADAEDRLIEIIDYPKLEAGSYLTNTGAYKLTRDFFNYEPVPMQAGSREFGLPQTLTTMTKDQEVKVIRATRWYQINTPADLGAAQEWVKSND